MKKYSILAILITTAFFVLLEITRSDLTEIDYLLNQWESDKEGFEENLKITYPRNGAVFPPDIVPPVFTWKDNSKADRWLIKVEIKEEGEVAAEFADREEWEPDNYLWKRILEKTRNSQAIITIIGVGKGNGEKSKVLSGNLTSLITSSDTIDAPIIYREIPLPFNVAMNSQFSFKWRRGTVNTDTLPPVIMEELPVCANCHSFSSNGRYMGMDVDFGSDKGSYILTELFEETSLKPEDLVNWNRNKNDNKSYGVFSRISPDGRYVVSTVKDLSVFESRDDSAYSHIFLPVRGILAIYDKKKDTLFALNGADNPDYVQTNPCWSPDGKYITFARTEVPEGDTFEEYKRAHEMGKDLDTTLIEEFVEEIAANDADIRFDLCRIPFNDGRGGEALEIEGASDNGMSNYFPKYSPDGKWIVFCRAENYMALQADSKLIIIPAEGGRERVLECNNDKMNSWHSWSPDSRWLVFASKQNGTYTDLYLAHIDENGKSAPPVLLRNFTPENMAANIPEFLDIPHYRKLKLQPDFLEGDQYAYYHGLKNIENENYHGAVEDFTKALDQDPGNPTAYLLRGNSYMEINNHHAALADYNKAIEIDPKNDTAYYNRGEAKRILNNASAAIRDYNKAIELNAKYIQAYNNRGYIYLDFKRYDKALADFNMVIEIDSEHPLALNNRGYTKLMLNDPEGALEDIEKSIEIYEKNPYAYRNLGLTYIRLNDAVRACEAFKKALELGYEQMYGDDVSRMIRQYCR